MSESSVTCAWCHGTVLLGEEHGKGVCVGSGPVRAEVVKETHVFDRAALDVAFGVELAMLRHRALEQSSAAATVGEGPWSLPFDVPRLPADTPLVARSPHVKGSTAYVLDGSLFADDRLRVLLAESASSEIVEAVQAQLEQRTREQDLVAWVERVMRFGPDGAPKPPAPRPVLFPWQRKILARVLSGEQLPLDTRPRKSGKSVVDRLLAGVCSACRTVGGHAPTCVTRVEQQLAPLVKDRIEGDIS